jgi:hypothetical protein
MGGVELVLLGAEVVVNLPLVFAINYLYIHVEDAVTV